MTERCASCTRRLYTTETCPVAQYGTGPFLSIGPAEYAAFNREWAWQSEWVPTLCRQCDTVHDHRKRPGAWWRLRRRVTGVAT